MTTDTDGNFMDIQLQLRGPLAAKLAEHSIRLKRRPIDLLADLIETILKDDMVVAEPTYEFDPDLRDRQRTGMLKGVMATVIGAVAFAAPFGPTYMCAHGSEVSSPEPAPINHAGIEPPVKGSSAASTARRAAPTTSISFMSLKYGCATTSPLCTTPLNEPLVYPTFQPANVNTSPISLAKLLHSGSPVTKVMRTEALAVPMRKTNIAVASPTSSRSPATTRAPKNSSTPSSHSMAASRASSLALLTAFLRRKRRAKVAPFLPFWLGIGFASLIASILMALAWLAR